MDILECILFFVECPEDVVLAVQVSTEGRRVNETRVPTHQRGVRNSRAGKRVRRKRRRTTATAWPTASPCRRPRSARGAPHGGRVLAHHPTAGRRNSSRSPYYDGDTRAQP